ncbi:hypothetical protein C8R47DRAFT_1202800, partial [Mycena vitilis]
NPHRQNGRAQSDGGLEAAYSVPPTELIKVINRDGNLPPTDLQSRDIRIILAANNVELVQLDAATSAISLILPSCSFESPGIRKP